MNKARSETMDPQEVEVFEGCKLNFIQILSADPVASLRLFVLQNVDINRSTLRFVLERVCDVDPSMREQVFKTLFKENVEFRKYSKNQFLTMVIFGVGISEQKIKDAFYEYIMGILWGTDQTALLSIDGVETMNSFLNMLKLINPILFLYCPDLHQDVRTFLGEVIKKTDSVLIRRMVEYLGKNIMTLPQNASIHELFLVDVLLDLLLVDSNTNIIEDADEIVK